MRVAQLVAPHRFNLVSGQIENPGPGEVQVRVKMVGVCGSDLHNFSEGSVGDAPALFPMVLGHEPAGVVVGTGPGVSGWSPGDRAALEPAIYCYHCEYCRSGRHNVCNHIRFLSQPGDPGFFRDLVNLPAANLLPLPPDLDLGEATLFEPLAIILHSMKLAEPRLGDTAAVFGAGPIGLLTIAILKLSGVRVWAVEPVAHRRELAIQMGADATIDPSAVDTVRQILADTGQRGVDFAIDCAAKGGSLDQAIGAIRRAGRVVVTGIPSEVRVEFDFHTLRRKEGTLLSVRRSNHESDQALDLIKNHRALFAPMLTHTRPIEDIEKAFFLLERYDDGVGKLIISLG